MDIPICYIFEGTDNLITIPNLPVQFDANIVEKFTFDLQPENLIEIRQYENKKKLLQSYGLINKKGKITGIGKFLTNSEFNKMITSKSILGFTVEDKLYEFYNNKYQDNKKVIHSSTLLGNRSIKGAEMDFEIRIDDKEYIAVEVKSSKQIKRFTSFEKQLIAKLELMKEKNKHPKEFHIVAHTANKKEFELDSILSTEFKKAKKIIEEFDNKIIVRIFKTYVKIKTESKRENPYSNFMQEGIKKDNFKEITIK